MRPCRLSSEAELNVNTVLPRCTFHLKVQATVKGTRQLQCSSLRHFFVYFLNVQKSLSLLKSLPCVGGLLFLSEGKKLAVRNVHSSSCVPYCQLSPNWVTVSILSPQRKDRTMVTHAVCTPLLLFCLFAGTDFHIIIRFSKMTFHPDFMPHKKCLCFLK